MTKKSTFKRNEPNPPDFELVFHPQGSVELFDADGTSVWQSDADDDFADEFEGDFFSADDDGDEILDYLDELGKIDLDNDDIDVIENDLEDESDVIDGEFTVKGRKQ